MSVRRWFFVLALLLALTVSVSAATRAWTGAASANWSDPGNWFGGIAPSANDDLVFLASSLNQTNSNDFPADTPFRSLTFYDTYTVSGNAIVLGEGGLLKSSNAPVVIDLPITLGASQSWSNLTGGGHVNILDLNGAVQLNGFTLTLTGTPPISISRIDGPISGAGTIVKTSVNVWYLAGNNSYTGQTFVSDGHLIAYTSTSLGAGGSLADGTIVDATGLLTLGPFAVIPEYIRLLNDAGNHGLNGISTDAELTGTLDLAGPNSSVFNELATLTFSGVVTGSGPFYMGSISGKYALMNSANDFTGPVIWDGQGTLIIGADNALPSGKALNIDDMSVLDLTGHQQSIASLGGTTLTQVRLRTGGILNITGPGTTSFAGNILDQGTINLSGGQLTLTAANTFTGAFNNNGGTLRIVGGSIVAPFTQTTGTFALASNGTAGAVTINGGMFSPGAGGTGTGNSGNLLFAPAATWVETIDGSAAGTFGSVRTTGSVNLGNAALTLAGGAAGVQLGDALVMIENDGSDAIAGTFAGLPEGATINGGPGNFNYTISYIGGTGNDVVLSALTQPIIAPDLTSVPTLDARVLAALALVLVAAAMIVLRQ